MTWFDYLFAGLGVLAALIVVVYAVKTGKFLKTVGFSALTGASALLILHFTAGLTGFSLELTPFTLSTSVIFGLPGVVCITLSKMIFGL